MNDISRTQIPNGGWQFHQAETGWTAPTPIASTFDQTVILIIKHRMANGALVVKHNWAVDKVSVGNELEAFTRSRLNIPTTRELLVMGAMTSGQRTGCCGG